MDVANTSTPYLSSNGGPPMEILLLQFLNLLCAHYNNTTQNMEQALQQCVHRVQLEEQRLNERIIRQEQEYAKIFHEKVNLQGTHLSLAKDHDKLKESLKECEEKTRELERQVEKEAKLQKAFEQLNYIHNIDGKINQMLSTLEKVSQNQNIGKDIYILENQLSLTNERLENTTEMYNTQNRKLEVERNKTQSLEERNIQLETALRKLQKEQEEQKQTYEAEIQSKSEVTKRKDQELKRKDEQLNRKNEELKRKDEELNRKNEELKRNAEELKTKHDEMKRKEEELKRKDEELNQKIEELKNKYSELTDEKRKNTELEKKQRESEKECVKSLEAQRSNCSSQLQQKQTLLESKLKMKEIKIQETQNQLKSCNEYLDTAKEQTVVARKNITKVIEFANQYRKYLATGNMNFAIAVYGDSEIKDIFRPSENVFGKQMTDQEARKEGFSCGNDRYIPKCFKCDGTDDCGNRNDERNCTDAVFPTGSRVVYRGLRNSSIYSSVATVVSEPRKDEDSYLVDVQWDFGITSIYSVRALQAAAGYFCGPT